LVHLPYLFTHILHNQVKSKGLPQQTEVAQGVPGRLRPRIFLTFRHYKGGRSSVKTPAAFTPGEIPGTYFQRLGRPQGTWFCRGTTEKIPSDTTGNRSRDRPQRLNHYATSGPIYFIIVLLNYKMYYAVVYFVTFSFVVY